VRLSSEMYNIYFTLHYSCLIIFCVSTKCCIIDRSIDVTINGISMQQDVGLFRRLEVTTFLAFVCIETGPELYFRLCVAMKQGEVENPVTSIAGSYSFISA
jgi:hypothetical protein